MPFLQIQSWSQFAPPASLSPGNLAGDTSPNDPAAPDYYSSNPSWIGETFTFNGGSPTQIELIDDDGYFQDGYVETGGAQTLAQSVTIDGTVYPAGSTVENEFSLIDANGQQVYVVRIGGDNVGFAYTAGENPAPGDTFTAAIGLDGMGYDNADSNMTSDVAYADILCFAAGTLIDTKAGPRAVETLQTGDLVMTLHHGLQPIRWIRSDDQPLDGADMQAKPVRIAAGALGDERPAQDLIVSPQHRILVGGHRQLQVFFETEAIAPAKSLTALAGIRHMMGKSKISWFHFAFDRHEIVTANGCLSESLLLGPMVMNGLTAAARRAVLDIFGPAATPGAALNGRSVLECLAVSAVRRHLAKCLDKTGQGAERDVQKWDADAAMERFEVDRLAEAGPKSPTKMKRVA